MEIAFILSLEHPTLPKAELKAVFEAENLPFIIKEEFDGFLILEIPEESCRYCDNEIFKKKTYKETYNSLERLALTHEGFQILISTNKANLIEKVQKYPWEEVITGDYAVRVKKKRFNSGKKSKSEIDTLGLEKQIGGLIRHKLGEDARVNLENPEVFIRTVIIGDRVFMGPRLIKISKKHFFELKPHKRPFFYPGSMSPKLARTMVNLTRIKTGERLLDPFCGTGGILLEAGIIGARVVGSDIDPKMVKGTLENLEHCGIRDFEVFRADVRKLTLPFRVDAVATDPPYGISASTRGSESLTLYGGALLSLEHLIKDDGLVCLATPHYMDIYQLVKGTKFEIIEQYHIRMHKSLTRVISVLRKI